MTTEVAGGKAIGRPIPEASGDNQRRAVPPLSSSRLSFAQPSAFGGLANGGDKRRGAPLAEARHASELACPEELKACPELQRGARDCLQLSQVE